MTHVYTCTTTLCPLLYRQQRATWLLAACSCMPLQHLSTQQAVLIPPASPTCPYQFRHDGFSSTHQPFHLLRQSDKHGSKARLSNVMYAVSDVPQVSNNAVAQPQGGGAQLTSTASATVTITGCPAATPPSPSPSSITTQAVNKTTVTVSVPKTTIAGSYQWSISKTASAASGSVSMAYNGTRTVSYTVQATKIPVASTYTLTVSISVNNPGSSSLTLTSLNAVLGPASVPAVCPGGNLVVPAGGTLTCTFPVNYNLGAKPGQISAVAGFPGGGTATPATPASFDWSTADTRGATGQCAVVTDVLAPQGLPPAAGLKVSGNKPAATAGTPVCDSTAYQYSIELGPFTAGDCGSYRVSVDRLSDSTLIALHDPNIPALPRPIRHTGRIHFFSRHCGMYLAALQCPTL
jgi:hypothetical protein